MHTCLFNIYIMYVPPYDFHLTMIQNTPCLYNLGILAMSRPIMAGGNSTGDQAVSLLDKSMTDRLWLVDALLLAGAILAGVIVGIGIFGQRYRYHRLTRFIFLGATTLYLPVMSTVVPLVAGSNDYVSLSLGWLQSAIQEYNLSWW